MELCLHQKTTGLPQRLGQPLAARTRLAGLRENRWDSSGKQV
jgi:hypothetical protein